MSARTIVEVALVAVHALDAIAGVCSIGQWRRCSKGYAVFNLAFNAAAIVAIVVWL